MIVGYFNFSKEGDPFSQVGFGLFLNANLAQTFILSSSPAISLVLFNEIHTAKWQGGYHAQGTLNLAGKEDLMQAQLD